VEEVGSEITNLKKGDRVVVPFPIACGKCFFCTHEASPACENSNFKHYGPHSIPLVEAAHGYQIFNEKEDDCVKVVLKP